jgi:hypothetical protein
VNDQAVLILKDAIEKQKTEPVDPYDLMEKIEIQIDPYSLFLMDEVILPGKIDIISGLKELQACKGYGFELELHLSKHADRKKLVKEWSKRLPRIEEYLDYIYGHSLWVNYDDE